MSEVLRKQPVPTKDREIKSKKYLILMKRLGEIEEAVAGLKKFIQESID